GNAPLPDVTIKVKGKNTATQTAADGTFSIAIPATSTVLEVSFVGYATRSFTVTDDQTNLLILLGRNQGTLNEVVVTALGIQKQSNAVGYSTAKVDGSKLTESREVNLSNALTGRVAGVSVAGVGTGPYGSSRVTIRGN